LSAIPPPFVIVYLDEGCPHDAGKMLRDQVRPRWCSLWNAYVPQRRLGIVLVTASETDELTAEAYSTAGMEEVNEQ